MRFPRRRPHRYARRLLVAEVRDFVRAHGWDFVKIAAGWVVLLATGLLWHGYMRGLYQGATSVLVLTLMMLIFLVHTSALDNLVGLWGEDNTVAEIKAARKTGDVWRVVNNIEHDGYDVDHA